MEVYAKRLVARGYCVVPLSVPLKACLRRASERLLREPLAEKGSLGISSSPGLLPGEPRAAPGFGGCPFPSSMHSKESREFLNTLHDEVFVPLALSLVTHAEIMNAVGDNPFIAHAKDRWCQRYAGQAPGSECPHRDISPDVLGVHRDVLMFGGFVNANTADGENQFFSCSPGTHVVGTVRDQGSGFAVIPEERRGDFEFETVVIPPGHALVFFENIVHKVRSRKYRYDILRLFTAFQLWKGEPPCPHRGPCGALDPQGRDCFLCTQKKFCTNGTLTHVKSKQENRLFPKLYRVNHKRKLELIVADVPAMQGVTPLPTTHPAVPIEPYTEAEFQRMRGRRLKISDPADHSTDEREPKRLCAPRQSE